MSIPKVSIIVPIYNVEKYLNRCMETLLNQTLKEIEIILVDDGSPDNCPQMCDEYAKKDDRIKVIHKRNEGLGFARNSGLEIATGEYVAFVDSDDYVDLNMYKVLYGHIKEYKLDAVLCGFKRVIDGKVKSITIDGVSPTVQPKVIFSQIDYIPNVIGCLPSSQYNQLYGYAVWNILFSNNIIQQHHIRFESERKFVSEDIIFQLDYASKIDEILLLPQSFYYYCQNDGSITTKYNPKRFEQEIELYREIRRRARKFEFMIDNLDLRVKRLLLHKTICSVCDTIKALNYKDSIAALYKISRNKELQNVLENYPIKQMTPKNKYFYLALKSNYNRTIYMIYKFLHRYL